jgi:3-phenylpropionate/cinnamic acid dioxygenase small subunit
MMSDTTDVASMDRIERECTRFLYREAELLDRGDLQEWLELLCPDIQYRVPVRTTRQKRDGEGFSNSAFFFDDDYSSLKLRVARLVSDFAWSDSPPARTRRMVSNVRVASSRLPGLRDNELAVTSNLALFSFRGESTTPVLLTGERQDVLRFEADGWKLRSRLMLLDTTIVGIDSLAIFF